MGITMQGHQVQYNASSFTFSIRFSMCAWMPPRIERREMYKESRYAEIENGIKALKSDLNNMENFVEQFIRFPKTVHVCFRKQFMFPKTRDMWKYGIWSSACKQLDEKNPVEIASRLDRLETMFPNIWKASLESICGNDVTCYEFRSKMEKLAASNLSNIQELAEEIKILDDIRSANAAGSLSGPVSIQRRVVQRRELEEIKRLGTKNEYGQYVADLDVLLQIKREQIAKFKSHQTEYESMKSRLDSLCRTVEKKYNDLKKQQAKIPLRQKALRQKWGIEDASLDSPD